MVGEIWKDIEEYENYQVSNLGKIRKIYKSGKIKMLKPIETKNGNLIKEWESSAEAERLLMIPNSDIIACCRNKRKTAGGYIWRYTNDR